jgi:hypothetical protein
VITPHVFFITVFLTVTWGFYFAYTVLDYLRLRQSTDRRRGDLVAAFRKVVVALCVLMLPLGFLVRTTLTLAGLGDAFGGQVLFFALVGTNVPGSIFVVVSLRFD